MDRRLPSKNIVVEVLAAIASENQLVEIKLLVDSLASDADSLHFFESKTFKNKKSHFTLGVCDANEATGELSMSIGAFHGTFTEDASDYFIFEWKSSSVELFTAAETLALNEDVFKDEYPDIKEKIKAFEHGNIKNTPLKAL